ncbi:aspartyl protease family protein [Paenibacillus radicis (ex Xue et al. 2023)]|uniref:Aspartyl protease family protein n=1 Tax=Paenibacillus radicis (ex Xue et al. 2023) TaxID=2972489 RepID=A0ABT1YV50_9BACL|nr:aspartyl protease family protein [Paenibacillus radicis (ex Xue et al. 2023)]MCR8636813.1 aspartyl protease family protein [Paenibacillus radicis (ex Xue et al. 2023)]
MMELRLENGLPIITFSLTYHEQTINMSNVLFDTGCASTIFDTDLVANIGLYLDMINGTAKRMYGVGGASELCYEQMVESLQIGTIILPSFKLQLGMTREPYGFDGILGIDFMTTVGIRVDFKKMSIGYD